MNIQDFDNPRADRGPNQGDAAHRLVADWIYDLPRLTGAHSILRQAFGGWEVAGILSARTGDRLIITETCASNWHCRPDYVGGQTVINDWPACQHDALHRRRALLGAVSES